MRARAGEESSRGPAGTRRLAFLAAVGVIVLSVGYGVPFAVGLLALEMPGSPVADPWVSMVEVLILLSTPMMVVLVLGFHAWVSHRRAFSLTAAVFTASTAVVACGVHFTILGRGHRGAIEALPWAESMLSFPWASVPHALDILAWDVFFAVAVLLSVPVVFLARFFHETPEGNHEPA